MPFLIAKESCKYSLMISINKISTVDKREESLIMIKSVAYNNKAIIILKILNFISKTEE
jgi:hypothetical protein